MMRVRPFMRIAGNLSLTTSDLSAKVPAFNAQRMLTDVGSANTRRRRQIAGAMPPSRMPKSPS